VVRSLWKLRRRGENDRLDEEEYFRGGNDPTEDAPFKEIKANWSEIVLYIGGILQAIRRLQILDSERCVGCQSCMLACTRREGRASSRLLLRRQLYPIMISQTIRTKTMAELCLRMLVEVFLNGNPSVIFCTDFLAKATYG